MLFGASSMLKPWQLIQRQALKASVTYSLGNPVDLFQRNVFVLHNT